MKVHKEFVINKCNFFGFHQFALNVPFVLAFYSNFTEFPLFTAFQWHLPMQWSSNDREAMCWIQRKGVRYLGETYGPRAPTGWSNGRIHQRIWEKFARNGYQLHWKSSGKLFIFATMQLQKFFWKQMLHHWKHPDACKQICDVQLSIFVQLSLALKFKMPEYSLGLCDIDLLEADLSFYDWRIETFVQLG